MTPSTRFTENPLDDRIAALSDRAAVLQIRDGAHIEDPVFAVRGFVPAEQYHDLQAAIKRHDCALHISDPQPGDPVPVQLKNNALTGTV